jgi:hypothetical protein
MHDDPLDNFTPELRTLGLTELARWIDQHTGEDELGAADLGPGPCGDCTDPNFHSDPRIHPHRWTLAKLELCHRHRLLRQSAGQPTSPPLSPPNERDLPMPEPEPADELAQAVSE